MLRGVRPVYHRHCIQRHPQCPSSFFICSKSSIAASPVKWPTPGGSTFFAPTMAIPSADVLPTRTKSTARKGSHLKAKDVPTLWERNRIHPYSIPHLAPDVVRTIHNIFALQNQAAMLQYVRTSPVADFFRDRDEVMKLAKALVLTPFPDRGQQVLWLAGQLGCSLKQSAYEVVAHQLSEGKHWRLIPPLITLGHNQTGRSTVRLMNWRILALIKLGHYGLLENIPRQLEEFNVIANQRTYHLLITAHIRNRNLVFAREWMKRMEGAGFPVDAKTHAAVTSVYRSLGPAQEVKDHAFAALPHLDGKTNTTVLNSLMQLHIDGDDFLGLMRVLVLFHHGNLDTTLAHDFGLIIPHAGNKAYNEVLTNMPNPLDPIMPDVITFTILIHCVAEKCHLPGTERLLERLLARMSASGVSLDAAAIAAVMRAYYSVDQPAVAIRIVSDICHNHDVPAPLFEALGPVKDDAFRCPISVNVRLEAIIFNSLLRMALDTQSLKGANLVLRIMRICNVKPDFKTIEIVASHLDQAKHARPRDLVRIIRVLTSRTIPVTLNHLHIVLRSILRREKFLLHGNGWDAKAAKFSKTRQDLSRYPEGRLLQTGEPFNPTAGMHAPRNSSQRRLLRPYLQSLSSRRISADRHTLALRLRYEANTTFDMIKANQVFQEMLARGMHPSAPHYAAMMEGYANTGNLEEARRVMRHALQAGFQPNVVMYTILIMGHAKQGRPGRSMGVFQQMLNAGIRPDQPAVDALVGSYFAVGAYPEARRLLLVLWPHVLEPLNGMEAMRLKELVQAMRACHATRNPNNHPHQNISKQERHLLRHKLIKLFRRWRASGWGRGGTPELASSLISKRQPVQPNELEGSLRI